MIFFYRKTINEKASKNEASEDIDEHEAGTVSESDDDSSDVELNEDEVNQNGAATETNETFENSNVSNEARNGDGEESDDEDESDAENYEDPLDESSSNLKSAGDTATKKRKQMKYSVVK